MPSKRRTPKLPRSVEIAGHRVQVRIRDLKSNPFGQYWPDDKIIEIDRTHYHEDRDAAWLTLRHEMMEATLYLSGVGWKTKYDQEPVVRALEQLFFPAWGAANRRAGRSICDD